MSAARSRLLATEPLQMSGEIVRLVPKEKAPPSDEALAMLDDIRARLIAGDIDAVAVVAVGGGREFHTAWYGWSGDLVAPAQLLAARLMTDLRGQ